MNYDLLGSIGLGLLILVWVGYRQTTWRVVDGARMWRLPLILGLVGIASLIGARASFGGIDVAALAIEIAVSAATGAWMGALAKFRPLAASNDHSGARWETRTGWWGLALWLLVVAVRVGIDVVAVQLGAQLVTSTGVILLLLGANRMIRVGVILSRAQQLDAEAPAGRATLV
ncbi:MAG: hypothetical protein QM582_03905 [Micropruina sp.]|uniref:hypothetical protein n=1 Tax=Micropruina sp. TaxID=2737536 RepID=UPI0039E3E01F